MRFWSLFLFVLLVTACKPQATGRTSESKKSASTPQARTLSDLAKIDEDAPVTDPKLGLCSASITHKKRVHIPPVAKPPFMRYYKDPAFGSKVIRISNSRQAEATKPAYSTMQAWNADESRLMLYRTGLGNVAHVLYDGHTYEEIGPLDISPVDLEQVWWSRKDPKFLFYVSDEDEDRGHFLRLNVFTGEKQLIKDLSKVCGANAIASAGDGVHMQAEDDDLFGFRCDNDKKTQTMFTYRLSSDEIVTAKVGDKTQWEANTAPSVAASGERLWMQGHSLRQDLKTIEQKLDLGMTDNHASIGRTHDGQDAMFHITFHRSPGGCDGDLWNGVAHVVEHNLETGSCRPIISEANGYPYPTNDTHLSALSTANPGWVAVSSIGADFDWFNNGRKAPVFHSEIYLTNSDPDNHVVCRLAHHRTFGKSASNEGYHPYFAEPHVTISPSGTRLLFGSDWYDSGAVDAYVIELPMHKKPE